MARSGGTAVRPTRRRLATVMFIDIAQSTELSAELGDRRWRALLERFRQSVRGNLKKYDGREQDTAGDGFYATFDDPSAAVYAAVASVRDSNEMGVNIRVGLHVGECDFIDGRLGGIAAAIGSRVVSMAQPGQVVATTTVRDLSVGSSARFSDLGVHELKGVPGSWQVLAIENVDGELMPLPLQRGEAVARIAAAEQAATEAAGVRKRRVIVAGVAVAVCIAVAIAVPIATSGGGHPARAKPLPAVFAIDPGNVSLVAAPTDAPNATGLFILGDSLWESTGDHFIRRDSRTGAVVQSFPFSFGSGIGLSSPSIVAAGLNAFWYEPGETYPYKSHQVQSISPTDGRVLTTTTLPEGIGLMAVGPDAVWDMTIGVLHRIDPSGHITGTWRTGVDSSGAGDLVVTTAPETVWFATGDGQIYQFSPTTGRTRLFTNVHAVGRLARAVDANGHTSVWFFGSSNDVYCITACGELTPLVPFGLGARATGIAISENTAFVAAGNVVYGISLTGGGRISTTLPAVVDHIVADPAGRIWVDNCFCTSVSDNFFNGGG